MVFTMLFSFMSSAQELTHHRCSNSEQYRAYMQSITKDPALAKQVQESLQKSNQTTTLFKKSYVPKDNKYVIPIVFHIIHDHGVENISDEKVHEALDIINTDYAAVNSDLSQLERSFSNIVGVPNIEFRLAKVDPNGNFTTGITRDVSPLTVNGSWDHPEVKRINTWPHEKYLNIWIVRSSNGSNGSAWAYLPYQVDNDSYADLDGIIISSWAFGATTEGYHRILTHEIGHFFNLYHTWSPWLSCGDKNACSEDDEVADTPNCTGYYGGCDVTHTSCGSLDMIQNYMDYATCPVAFTRGQVQRMHAALNSKVAHRNNLWSQENLNATLYPDFVLIDIQGKKLVEGKANDGSFTDGIQGRLVDYKFNQDKWDASKVTFENVPLGTTPVVTLVNDHEFLIKLDGKAAMHQHKDDGLMKVSFDASLMQEGVNIGSSVSIPVVYRDPYAIVHVQTEGIHVDPQNTWNFFSIKGTSNSYGLWFDKNMLRLEAYQQPLVCQENSENIVPLTYGSTIDKTKEWNPGGAYPNEHNFVTSDYSQWKGHTAFLGFQVINTMGEPIYGWMKVAVNKDGNAADLLEYAFNTNPNEGILAGQKENEIAAYTVTSDIFNENKFLNDGSIDASRLISFLDRYQLVGNKTLQKDVDYTIENLPEGLSSVLVVNNGGIDVKINGKASAHAVSDNSVFSITFSSSVFTGSESYTEAIPFKLSFLDPYRIVTGKLADVKVNSEKTWKWFSLFKGGPEYGDWHYEANHIKLETYNKECVTMAGTRNIRRLTKGEIISASSNWQAPGTYPDQLDVFHNGYSAWYHTNGYIGIVFSMNGTTHYGWLKGEMYGPGTEFTVSEFGYNEKPNAPIRAGEAEEPVVIEAEIVCNKSVVETNNEVQYTFQCAQTIDRCVWTFEGATPNQYEGITPPAVVYANAGSYDVSVALTVGDKTARILKENIITVNQPKPVTAEILGNHSMIRTGESVLFTVDGSYPIENCVWRFDGGTPNHYEGITPPEIVYSNEGVYNVEATVTLAGKNISVVKENMITVREEVQGDYCIPEVRPMYLGLKLTEVAVNYNGEPVTQEGYVLGTRTFELHTSDYNVLAATVTPAWNDTHVRFWIDWNGNGEFEDNEHVADLRGPSSRYGVVVNVPDHAVSSTRMRCMLYYGNKDKKACDAITYQGMVVDYPVHINRNKRSVDHSQINLLDEAVAPKIYPNPCSENLSIVLSEDATVILATMDGKIVIERIMEKGDNMIDVSSFAPGIYILKVTNSNITKQLNVMIK